MTADAAKTNNQESLRKYIQTIRWDWGWVWGWGGQTCGPARWTAARVSCDHRTAIG